MKRPGADSLAQYRVGVLRLDSVLCVAEGREGVGHKRLQGEKFVGDFELNASDGETVDGAVIAKAQIGVGNLHPVVDGHKSLIVAAKAESGESKTREEFDAGARTRHPAEIAGDRKGKIGVGEIDGAYRHRALYSHVHLRVAVLVFEACLERPAVVETVLIVEIQAVVGGVVGSDVDAAVRGDQLPAVHQILVHVRHAVAQCATHAEAELMPFEVERGARIASASHCVIHAYRCQQGHSQQNSCNTVLFHDVMIIS